MKEPVDIEHTHTKNSRFITYDSSDYDGGGLYDDQGEQSFPDSIYCPSKL